MFNQRSAFDEALSRPLVPAARAGGKANRNSRTGRGGEGGGEAHMSSAAAEGRLPSFSPQGNSGGGKGAYRAPKMNSSPPSARPPSAVSSVVSSDDDDTDDDDADANANDARAAARSSSSEYRGLELQRPLSSSSSSRDPNQLWQEEIEEDAQRLQQDQQQQQLGHECLETALLRERHSVLAELARSMGLVRTIQSDLSALVQSQQEDIDDIEANADETRARAEEGVEQLARARTHQKDGRSWGTSVAAAAAGMGTVGAMVFWLLAK